MNALRHDFDLSHADALPALRPAPDAVETEALQARWDALHHAADAVAELAQLGRETIDATLADLPLRASEQGGSRARLVAEGIDDLAAVMQTGLRALIVAQQGGADTTAAALTLWREFHAGRKAIVACMEPLAA